MVSWQYIYGKPGSYHGNYHNSDYNCGIDTPPFGWGITKLMAKGDICTHTFTSFPVGSGSCAISQIIRCVVVFWKALLLGYKTHPLALNKYYIKKYQYHMLLDSTDGELYSGWGTYQQVGHVEIIGLENVFDYFILSILV